MSNVVKANMGPKSESIFFRKPANSPQMAKGFFLLEAIVALFIAASIGLNLAPITARPFPRRENARLKIDFSKVKCIEEKKALFITNTCSIDPKLSLVILTP